MIRRIYIDNYKCFSNFEWRPEPVNLLLGDSGTGRTSVLEVLAGLRDLGAVGGTSVEEEFPAGSRTRWDSRPLQRFELDLDCDGELFSYELEVEAGNGRRGGRIHAESVKHGSDTLYAYADGVVHLHRDDGSHGTEFPFGGRDSFLARIEPRPENRRLCSFRAGLAALQVYRFDPVRMQDTSESEADLLDETGANFASWYRSRTQVRPEGLAQLFEDLARVMPGFRSLRLADAGRARTLEAALEADAAPYAVSFAELSDGQRMLVVNYALARLGVDDGALLAIDEPGNFVALADLQPWLAELCDAVQDHGQLFVISHHPEVIDYLAPAAAFVFERPRGGPVRVRPFEVDRDEGVRASEVVARGLHRAAD